MTMLQHGLVPSTGGYRIERSLRFNSADSARLTRTFASAGNRKTWSISAWVKCGVLGTNRSLFGAEVDGSNSINFRFDSDNNLDIYNIGSGSVNARLITTQVFRDPSAWYHILFVWDTTQASGTNRMRLYVNGSEVTTFNTDTNPTQNLDGSWNTASQHEVGAFGGTAYFNGYMTEVSFIDGSAKTPSDFGETDTDTGVWKPKAYSGTYGTNGFYLKFADNSGTTSTTLGKDSSGNGNNWTPNNFSVTAGAGNDSLVDTPTPYGTDTGAGGEVRGNYCTLNPLSTTDGTYTQGNLRYTGNNSGRRSNGTISVSTGKWYWEVTLGNSPNSPRDSTSGYNSFGFGLSTVFNSTVTLSTTTDAVYLADNGYYKNFSGSWTDGGTAFASGDVLSVAVDLDANTFTFRRNNTQIVTGTIGGTAGRELVPMILSYNGSYGVMDCNFGQRPFAYTAPSGFKALCTQNLPTPTIGATATSRANNYFDTIARTFTGASASITSLNFAPDFLWFKRRNAAASHSLYDKVRGSTKRLITNDTLAEITTGSGELTSFDSNGFTVGADTGSISINGANGDTGVVWCWRGNGAGSTNNAGSIQSTVSANTTAGFSIVTYTGNGTSGATVGHGCLVNGAATTPSMVILKRRDSVSNWQVKHVSLNADQNLELNSTAAVDTAPGSGYISAISSTTLTLLSGGAITNVNANTGTYLVYCFAPVAGYSAFGSFTGNGSTDGAFVYTGFRPAWVMMKVTSDIGAGGNWGMFDNDRLGYNPAQRDLRANLSNAEGTDDNIIDFLSNGFKIRTTSGGFGGGSGNTYIYAAFAESPFKYSLGR